MKKILHIMHNAPFLEQFIPFINENFEPKQHLFLIIGGANLTKIPEGINVKYFPKLNVKVILEMFRAERVIFHGMFNFKENFLYSLNPWVLRKSYWIIWGGDLYEYTNRDQHPNLKRKLLYKINDFVKGNMAGYITHIEGDYELAKKWFNASGKYYNCFMYLSNLYKAIPQNMIEKDEIYIQVGNSANPSNNHKEILDRLLPHKSENIKLFCPLSYGDPEWAEEVKSYGEKLFGDKFVAMMDFMIFEDYCKFNNSVDIAIFAHNRQQAIGNITSLLGMGKTVYLRKTVTTASMLDELAITYFDFNNLEILEQITIEHSNMNKQKIKERFSAERLKKDLEEIFK